VLADALYRDLGATDVAAVAVRLLTLRRHVLRADDHRLVDIVAASSAVPPVVRPHRIDGRRYLDGGVRSLASADLAPDADLLVLLTPFAARGQGITGRIGAWQARREIRRWTRRTGGDVLHVVPSPEMAAISSSRLSDVGDMRFGRAVYPLAVELGHHVGELIASERPGLVTTTSTNAGAA
jgi:NTE family protein